jgi:hypothetical protein
MLPATTVKSRFLDYLLAHNQPAMAGFKGWVFKPGMGFNSREQWWARQNRPTPHEGLDLCCFADTAGRIHNVDRRLKIPATFAGVIVKIAPDFLGKSIYLAHKIVADDGRQLYTAYGHTDPVATLQVGRTVNEGEIMARLSGVSAQKTAILPHLHLTLAWLPVPFPPRRLTWKNLATDPAIVLIDPLTVLDPGDTPNSPQDCLRRHVPHPR